MHGSHNETCQAAADDFVFGEPDGCCQLEEVFSSRSSTWGSECSSTEHPSSPSAFSDSTRELEAAVIKCWQSMKVKDVHGLAFMLCFKHGFITWVRTNLGPRAPSDCTRNLRHKYLLVSQGPGEQPFIVDPSFRDQFKIALPESEYDSFLKHEVPEVFVGTHSTLMAMLRVISELMQRAFRRLQLSMPPWRDLDALASKWDPIKWQDVQYGPDLTHALQTYRTIQQAQNGMQPSTTVSVHGRRVLPFSQRNLQASPVAHTPPTVIRGFAVRSPVVSCAMEHAPVSSKTSCAGAPVYGASSSGGSTTAVSSLSDGIMAAEWADRKAGGKAKQPAAGINVGDMAKVQQAVKELAQAGSGVQAAPATAGAPGAAQRSRVFKPLDQLLPQIRTIRLGA
mmetsp:Transcript_37721/g.84037  ORF Transcript_37721/g.84037 Transcript_37721/m.84037 type:complete len:394 (+) Transcript_37721:237-1418(+)